MLWILFALPSISGLASWSQQLIFSLSTRYGYWSIFALMAMESSSLPVPSEVVMSVAGLLAAQGAFSFEYAFIAGLAGATIGMAVDYYIAYFIEKDVVYKHLKRLHLSEKRLDAFSEWFERNGSKMVFLTRLLPVVRTVISFPAGFAKMDQKKFFAYSISGTAIWNAVLMAFGYYALNANNAALVMAAVAVAAILLYLAYAIVAKRVRKRG